MGRGGVGKGCVGGWEHWLRGARRRRGPPGSDERLKHSSCSRRGGEAKDLSSSSTARTDAATNATLGLPPPPAAQFLAKRAMEGGAAVDAGLGRSKPG